MSEITFHVVRAGTSDIHSHLNRLAEAFVSVHDGDADYNEMLDGIHSGEVSVYHLTGDGVDLTLAGEIVDDAYFIWAVCGRGLRPAIAELSRRVSELGLSALTCGTGKPSAARLYRQALGAVTTHTDEHTNGQQTTWHRLEVVHG
ncbi:DNAase [Photobacterium halotolerans]|uniref:DNAase n=1 Tax=Photobacterium halotolerans TaxID=265726 RepID=UPI0013735DA4|nr:DNAase [Photobacterium halotolerans]NAW87160.1 DNAase [Photobacterium halotolerans]